MVERGADRSHLVERKNEEEGNRKMQLLPTTYQEPSPLKGLQGCERHAAVNSSTVKDLPLDQARKMPNAF